MSREKSNRTSPMPQTSNGFRLTQSKGQSIYPGLQAPSSLGLFPLNSLLQPLCSLGPSSTLPPQGPCTSCPPSGAPPPGLCIIPFLHSGLCVPVERPSLNSLFSCSLHPLTLLVPHRTHHPRHSMCLAVCVYCLSSPTGTPTSRERGLPVLCSLPHAQHPE